MKLDSSLCPVCGKFRGRGHPICSKKLQKVAGPGKNPNNRNKVYTPYHVDEFLRVIDERSNWNENENL